MIQTAAPGNPQPVNVQEDTAIFGGNQYAEYLLCETCEQRIGRWENYVAGIALQRDDTFPALVQTAEIPGLTIENWRIVDLSGLQTATLARFAASVVWRASASSLFDKVSLGTYSAAFAAYLLDDNAPVPKGTRILVQLIDHERGPRVDRVVVAPASSREGNYHVHHFAMFGMWFQVIVGGVIPGNLDQVCLAMTQRGIVTDGARLQQLVHEAAKKATPKGGLARRTP